MNKNEFLQRLKEDLSSLTDEEIANALKYYEEYFADAGDDKEEVIISEFVSPENIADKIKDEVHEVQNKDENILKIDFNNYTYENVSEAYNDSTVKTERNNADNSNNPNNSNNSNKFDNSGIPANNNNNHNKYYRQKNNTWKIVLLLCTAPFWLPMFIALASVAFGVFMALLGVTFAIAAIAVAGFVMAGAGALSIGYGISSIFINVFQAFYPIGAGLIVLGLGIIIAYAFTKLAVAMFKSQVKFLGFVIRGITGRFSPQGAKA